MLWASTAPLSGSPFSKAGRGVRDAGVEALRDDLEPALLAFDGKDHLDGPAARHGRLGDEEEVQQQLHLVFREQHPGRGPDQRGPVVLDEPARHLLGVACIDGRAGRARRSEGEPRELQPGRGLPRALLDEILREAAHRLVLLVLQYFEPIHDGADRADHIVADPAAQEGGKIQAIPERLRSWKPPRSGSRRIADQMHRSWRYNDRPVGGRRLSAPAAEARCFFASGTQSGSYSRPRRVGCGDAVLRDEALLSPPPSGTDTSRLSMMAKTVGSGVVAVPRRIPFGVIAAIGWNEHVWRATERIAVRLGSEAPRRPPHRSTRGSASPETGLPCRK